MRGRVLDDSEEEDEARPAPLPLKPTMGCLSAPVHPPLCSFDSFSFTRDCPPPMSLVQPHSLFISQGIASLLCTPHLPCPADHHQTMLRLGAPALQLYQPGHSREQYSGVQSVSASRK